MWDTTSDRKVLTYRHSALVSTVAWSAGERHFAFASGNKTIQVWNTIANLNLFTFYHTTPVRVMA
ncbi:MAG: hypothetical protein E6I91_14255 [Chloroflexi bacterium]|nr:MAG: hypothetical protein E6I91_14255 [Chloroflexota bacterium]